MTHYHHLGADAPDDEDEDFDPAEALAAEGIPVPQPIDLDDDEPWPRYNTMEDILRDLREFGPGLTFPLSDCSPEVVQQLAATGVIPADMAPPVDVVNPKELAGSKKPAIWSVMPRWVALAVGRVMSVGAAKYGKFNYRESAIAASTYEDAIERHASLWFDGEDNDPETGVSHLASVIASCLLLMDAQRTGKLHDDRQKTGIVRQELDALERLLRELPLPSRK